MFCVNIKSTKETRYTLIYKDQNLFIKKISKMKLSVLQVLFLCICTLTKIVTSSDILSQLPATAESFTDMLITPVKEIRTSFSPASTANLTRAIMTPELKVFRETALGIKSFLSDLKDVAAAVDNALQDPLKDNDKSNLLSFRDSLDKAYKKTEDLYEKFESNFNGTRSDRTIQDKVKYGSSLTTARQNIAVIISQIEDEFMRNIKDSLISQGVKKYSMAPMEDNSDIEHIRDVFHNDINDIEEDKKGSFSPDNGLFKTMKEWSDFLKNFRQRKSWNAFNESTNSINKERTESLNKNVFGISPSSVDSNNGLASLIRGDVLGSTSSLLANVTAPLTKIYSNGAPYRAPMSSSLGGRMGRMLMEDNDKRSFFRPKYTANNVTRNEPELDYVSQIKPSSLSNMIKTTAEKTANASKDLFGKSPNYLPSSSIAVLENTFQNLNQKLRSVLGY